MKINRGPSADKRIFICPQCGKPRMLRDLDHKVSTEKKEFKSKSGAMVSLFIDTCDRCVKNNFTKYFEPTKEDVRKIMKAISENTPTEESLENLL